MNLGFTPVPHEALSKPVRSPSHTSPIGLNAHFSSCTPTPPYTPSPPYALSSPDKTPTCAADGAKERLPDTQSRRHADFIVGDYFDHSSPQGIHGNSFEELVGKALRGSCDAVCRLASSHSPDVLSMSDKLSRSIATDLETRLSKMAKRRKRHTDFRGMACYKYTRDKGHAADPLDAWTIAILEWADCSEPTANDDGESCSDSQYSDDSKSSSLKAYVIAPCFEAILLFVAHHIEAYFSKQIATGLHRSEDYRLILPIANEGTETDCTYFYSADHEDPYTIARVECGMFPLGSSVERQKTSLPHTIVADTEIAADKDGLGGAVRRLAMKTRELYCTQHNRIFAWGLTVASCTIHAYVFGLDDVWGSRGMDITVAEGRQALISLLVDWSLCSADRLRFDTSIRYALNNGNNNPCLELDVYDANESTGEVERHIHYSKQCIDASVSLTGRHARYFASSTDIATLGTPTFLIKDAWTPLSCGTRESSFLDFIHTTFDNSSELSGRFPRIVSTGPVFISRGDSVVEDSTETAFAGLPNISRVRQHRRTVTRWAGNRISAAADANQVIIAISDAMVAYNAAHEQCNLLHGNIIDRAILFQETVDNGVSGVLAEFDYATFDGGSAGNTVEPETPELSMFSSIRSLEGAEVASRTRLDDCESLLYLICVLGTFGVNRTEREKFAAVLPDILPIKGWNVGKAGDIADLKRTHMETVGTFETNIASKMRDLELRQLAVDLHHALFQHPGCSGACLTRKASLSDGSEQIDSSGSDPLVLRRRYEREIFANFLRVLDKHRQKALAAHAAQREAAREELSRAEPATATATAEVRPRAASPTAGPPRRLRRIEVPRAGPAMGTRSMHLHQGHGPG